MLNIWILERSNKESMQRVCSRISERLRQEGRSADIQWRIVPRSSFWPECVRLVKSEPHTVASYPDLIEYPAYLEPSLRYLKLLGRPENLAEPLQGRWQALAQSCGMEQPLTHLSIPWLKGYLSFFYRKDVLRSIHRKSEDLENYSSWMLCLEAAAAHFPQGALETQADFQTALWWIGTFGGEFLDPLNLTASFTNAEALKGLSAMIRVTTSLAHRGGGEGWMQGWPGGYSRRGYFPEAAFGSLSYAVPRSVFENDLRVGCSLVPQTDQRVTTARQYCLAATARGVSERGEAVTEFMESLLGAQDLWVEIGRTWGLMPADRALQELFWHGVLSEEVRSAYEQAPAYIKRLPEMPLIGSLARIFEDTLEDCLLAAVREGAIDMTHLASSFSKAASEYRLITSLYGPMERLSPPEEKKAEAVVS